MNEPRRVEHQQTDKGYVPVYTTAVVDQPADYPADDHATWGALYERQRALLVGRACDEFLQAQDAMGMTPDRIPRFDELNDVLRATTGWQLVGVEGLLPELEFFDHLANRRFVSGQFIRKPDQLDYLQEPDIFHDVFGHVPMLTDPDFAAYMEAYGKGGQRAASLGMLPNLARLYWYTVEFGLMQEAEGLRIYGAGIVSSATESVFALDDPSPNRIGFDLERVMRTLYRIDDFQQVYFVIDSLEALKAETLKDFGPVYEALKGRGEIAVDAVLPEDRLITRGTQSYAARGGRFAA